MHEIKLNDLTSDKALTQAVLQISQLLGMYQAELARVLGVQCNDIGAYASAQKVLQASRPEWEKARLFVSLYERLYGYFAGDATAIYHWLRVPHERLATSPLLAIVDEGRLDEVVNCL